MGQLGKLRPIVNRPTAASGATGGGRRISNPPQVNNLMPHTFDPIDHPAQIVGQPILAAAGFQPAFAPQRLAHVPKKPSERRLRARLPAPQQMQNIADVKSMRHWVNNLLHCVTSRCYTGPRGKPPDPDIATRAAVAIAVQRRCANGSAAGRPVCELLRARLYRV